jgi:hypothetical protein
MSGFGPSPTCVRFRGQSRPLARRHWLIRIFMGARPSRDRCSGSEARSSRHHSLPPARRRRYRPCGCRRLCRASPTGHMFAACISWARSSSPRFPLNLMERSKESRPPSPPWWYDTATLTWESGISAVAPAAVSSSPCTRRTKRSATRRGSSPPPCRPCRRGRRSRTPMRRHGR